MIFSLKCTVKPLGLYPNSLEELTALPRPLGVEPRGEGGRRKEGGREGKGNDPHFCKQNATTVAIVAYQAKLWDNIGASKADMAHTIGVWFQLNIYYITSS